jgi:hypothetical protein
MSKIVKNNTGSTVTISDTGISVPASGTYTIPPNDYPLWAASDDIVTYIGDSSVTINDGSNDLSIADGTRHIQSTFLTIDNQDSDDTKIRGTETLCLLQDIVKQLKTLNYQISLITDYEDYDELNEERL